MNSVTPISVTRSRSEARVELVITATGRGSEFWTSLEPLKDLEAVAQRHPQIEQHEKRRHDFMRPNSLEHSDELLAVVKYNEGILHPRRSQASLNEKQVVRIVVRNKNGGWCLRCGHVAS
jgi:hypothetical protein